VPRIPDQLLDSVIYLYRCRQDAESGERTGGTGFLVSEPATVPGAPATLYAVTNSHVIREGQISSRQAEQQEERHGGALAECRSVGCTTQTVMGAARLE
jgi:hypothetical protein